MVAMNATVLAPKVAPAWVAFGEYPRPDKMALDTRLLRVAGDVSQEGRWGSDGACLKGPSCLCETAIADIQATNSDGTAVSSLDTDEDILLDLPAPSNSVSLAEAYGSAGADAYRVQVTGLQTSQVQSLIVSSNVGDQFQDSLTATAGGVESSLPFVLADNGGQPLTAAQQSQILSTYDVNAIDPEPGLGGVTLRLKTGSDSFSRKLGDVTPVVVWVDTTKMPKGFNLQATQATMNQVMSSAGITSPVLLLPMTYAGSAGKIGNLTGQGYQYYFGPTGGLVQVSSAWLQQQLKAAAQQQKAFQQAQNAIAAYAAAKFAQSHLTPTFQDRVEEFQSLYGYYITHPFSEDTPTICKAGNVVAYGLTGVGVVGLLIVGAAPAVATAEGATLLAAEGTVLADKGQIIAEEAFVEETLAEEALASSEINITESGLQHILSRHLASGVASAGKSLFAAGEDVAALVRQGKRCWQQNKSEAILSESWTRAGRLELIVPLDRQRQSIPLLLTRLVT